MKPAELFLLAAAIAAAAVLFALSRRVGAADGLSPNCAGKRQGAYWTDVL